jgi:DNA-binding response OmpR family regulator
MSKLLIIDHDPTFGQLIQMVFYNQNIYVLQVFDADEGLGKADQLHPDVVIVNVELTELQRENNVIERFRRSSCLKHLPLIVVSDGEPNLAWMEQFSISAFFRKPFSSTALRGHVLYLLGRDEAYC